MLDNQSAKKLLARSVFMQIFGQIVMGISGVIVLKLMTTNLGSIQYGVYSTVIAFVTTFTLFTDLGLNSISSREIAKHPDKTSEIIDHNMGLRLGLSLIMIPVVFLVGMIVYPEADTRLRIGILLMSAFLFIDSVWAISASYFTSKIRNDIPASLAIAQQLLFLLMVVLLGLMGAGIYYYIIAYLLAVGTCSIGAYLLVRRHVPIRPRCNLGIWKRYIFMSLSLGIMSVVNIVYLKVDTIMISTIVGTTASGIYTVAYSLIYSISAISGFVMFGITPLLAVSSKNEFGRLVQKASHLLLVVGLLIAIIAFYTKDQIILMISNEAFIEAAVPFSILAVATIFSYQYTVFSLASVAKDKHHKIIYISIAALVVNLLLNCYLIPRHGINGAAFATLISEMLAVILVYDHYRRETKQSIHLAIVVRPALAGLLTFLVGLIIQNYIDIPFKLVYILTLSASLCLTYGLTLSALKGVPEDLTKFGILARDKVMSILNILFKSS